MKSTVYLEAGHHKKDPGAVALGKKEAELTIELRNMIAHRLRELGVSVVVDNDDDDLAAVTRKWKPGVEDILLSLHFNAAPSPSASGTEVFVEDGCKKADRPALIARELIKACSEVAGFNIRNGAHALVLGRGVKYESESARKRLAILKECACDLLLEVCFMTNTNDMAKYQTHKVALANAIAHALSLYAN